MSKLLSSIWTGFNAAVKDYKGTNAPVTTTSTDPKVQALADDATLVQGIVALIIQAVPAASLVESVLTDVVHNGLQLLVTHVASGVAAGATVSDGAGGFVPTSNSKYDPKTGAFL